MTRPVAKRPVAKRPAPPAPERPPAPPVDAVTGTLAVLVVTVCAGFLAFWAALLVPVRIGGVLCPVAILLAAATTWAAPMALRYAGLPLPARFPPLVVWFAVILLLSSRRSEGDVLLPAGDLAWVSYGVMLAGFLAGAAALLRPERRVEFRP